MDLATKIQVLITLVMMQMREQILEKADKVSLAKLHMLLGAMKALEMPWVLTEPMISMK